MSKTWKWCLVDENNTLLTGWQQVDGIWFYLTCNGTMAIGWIKVDNKWYYLSANGAMVSNCTLEIEGKNYNFNTDGSMVESLVSNECIDFIKSWEGFSATPYRDEVNILTLGYGMTGEEIQGISEVTEEEATSMLKDWINNKYAPVIKLDLESKGISLNQSEFDALVSMSYNVGTGGLLGSTLYKNVVADIRDSSTITSNFQAWSKAGGQRLEGLYRRRTKEAAMFLNADYTGNV